MRDLNKQVKKYIDNPEDKDNIVVDIIRTIVILLAVWVNLVLWLA